MTMAALDPVTGASCPANVPVLPSLANRFAVIRAVHFEGGVGGIVLSARDNSGGSHAFFTRVRCQPLCPSPPG
jgi:hypothetical protein